MKKLLKTLFKMIFWSLILLLLIPPVYFAWRAAQPMGLPEFNGLTYYQYFEWRNMKYQEQLEAYVAKYPGKEIKNTRSCIQADLLMDNVVAWPLAAIDLVKQGKSPLSLSDLWIQREKLLWNSAIESPYGSEYCRFQPDVPDPEQFEAMKRKQENFAMRP